ncbi:class I SAM-dependent DNA methyltransferase [Ekhidna sp.]|uniref:class I SAM-dependent DNA methyltransferase n=1 Tax=Ekhidna sp. TaxID=2608089 RepID=UPI003CCBF119
MSEDNYQNYHKAYWDGLSELEGFRSVLDPNDRFGTKNLGIHELHQKQLDSVFKKLDFKKNRLVLDFGCGIGRNTAFLLKYFDEYIGVDQSCKMLEKAKDNFPTQRFVLSSDDQQIMNIKVDLFFSFWVFQHIIQDEDLIKTLNYAYSILKSKGFLIFCERSALSRREEGMNEDYIVHRDPKEYISMVKGVGFRKVMIRKLNYRKSSLIGRIRKINRTGENIYVFQKA